MTPQTAIQASKFGLSGSWKLDRPAIEKRPCVLCDGKCPTGLSEPVMNIYHEMVYTWRVGAQACKLNKATLDWLLGELVIGRDAGHVWDAFKKFKKRQGVLNV